jgi:hypothetical protein
MGVRRPKQNKDGPTLKCIIALNLRSANEKKPHKTDIINKYINIVNNMSININTTHNKDKSKNKIKKQ